MGLYGSSSSVAPCRMPLTTPEINHFPRTDKSPHIILALMLSQLLQKPPAASPKPPDCWWELRVKNRERDFSTCAKPAAPGVQEHTCRPEEIGWLSLQVGQQPCISSQSLSYSANLYCTPTGCQTLCQTPDILRSE